MEKEGISKTKTVNHVKRRSKKRRKIKRSRRLHKHEVEEEVKCASSASDSDESLGTFCDRYERKQKTKKGMFVYFRNIKITNDDVIKLID